MGLRAAADRNEPGEGFLKSRRAALVRTACCVLGLALATLGWPGPLSAAEQPQSDAVRLESYRVGFAGRYKVGFWAPVEVVLKGGAQTQAVRVELVTADGDGVRTRVWANEARPAQLLAGQPLALRGQVKFGRMSNTLEIVVRGDDDVVLVRRQFDSDLDEQGGDHADALRASQQLFINVGPPVGLDAWVRQIRGEEVEDQVTVVELPSIDELPTRWLGYDGVDWLVLSGSDPELFRTLTPESPQRKAIEDWVARGGRLLLAVGAQAPELLAPEGPLASLAPGRFVESYNLSLTSALEEFAGSTQPLVPAGAASVSLLVPRLDAAGAVVECREADLPLVVRQPRGFGEVTFVALDLNASPVAEWKGRTALLAKLIHQPLREATDDLTSRAGRVSWLGISDLAGQLRGALDQFSGIELVPFALVATLVAVYVLLIGPVDYWIVRRLLGRMELTWITFPLIVLGVCLGAYGFARSKKGNELRVNQVDLVDVDLASGLTRGTSWANVFSPRAASYDVDFVRPAPAGSASAGEADSARLGDQLCLSWFGLPGEGFGGLDSLGVEGALWNDEYRFAPHLERLEQMPMQVWSSKSLVARWTASGPPPIEAALRAGADGVPTGTLTNRSDEAWHDVLLAYGRWGITLRRPLEPGQSIDLETDLVDLERTELVTRLTQRVMVFDNAKKEYVRQARAYDQASFDCQQILRQMMFYEAAGGENYARLLNRYQSMIDLSGHLALGRGVLVVRRERPAGQLQLDGQAVPAAQVRQQTFYRYVLPVEPVVEGN